MDEATKAAIDRSRAALGAAENEAIRARGMVNAIEVGADGDVALAAIAHTHATLALQATIAVAVDLFLAAVAEEMP